MERSRTIKMLIALLISMTVGTFILIAFAGDPIPLATIRDGVAPSDEAMKVIRDTKFPLRQNWLNVVIHSSNVEPSDISRRVHFVIDAAGNLSHTDLWTRQMDGNHVFIYGADWNAVTIGVLVNTDPSRKRLQAQSDALDKLLDGLRRECRIDDAHVYRHYQLQTSPPGAGCGVFH